MIDQILSVLLIITGFGLIYYWLDFYLRKGVQVIQENWYTKFQKACSVADMWIATCAILGAIGLLTKQSYGLFFAILAGSPLIFLAILDIAFNIQNKLYRLVGKSGEMASEVGINVCCLLFGLILIVCLGPRII